MDYAQETTFSYSDWKQINDPKLKFYVFQGQSEGEFKNYLNIPNSLRTLRISQRYNIDLSVEKNSGGELQKGFSFFEYETQDKITLFYEKSGILKNFSFTKDEKHSNFYNKPMYQIKIGNFGYFNCLSQKDRDVLYDFLIQQEFGYMLNNKVAVQKKTYSYNLLYNDLEKIKADLIRNGKYKNLSENEKLLLDLPLIMWGKKWEYGAIFMYNWFMEEGDIEMDDDLYAFLDRWKELENKFKEFIRQKKGQKIVKQVEENKFNTYAFRLYALNSLKKYISKIDTDTIIKLSDELNENHLNFSRYSLKIGWFDNINTPYVASFGTFSIKYLLEGNYNKEKEEISVTNIWEQVDDSFDFEGFQPLGEWNKSIFKYHISIGKLDVIDQEDLNIYNSTFNSFKQKTGIGKDYKIKGLRKNDNLFIKTIKIEKNKIQYE